MHNRGSAGCSYIARSDCARAAAAVVAGEGHAGEHYELTGAESLDARALAALYSDFGDREVEAVSVDDDELLRLLDADASADGHVQYGAALAISLGRAIREEYFAGVTTTFAELTGTAPWRRGSSGRKQRRHACVWRRAVNRDRTATARVCTPARAIYSQN